MFLIPILSLFYQLPLQHIADSVVPCMQRSKSILEHLVLFFTFIMSFYSLANIFLHALLIICDLSVFFSSHVLQVFHPFCLLFFLIGIPFCLL